MGTKKPPPARRAYRVAITLHPRREADLYDWTQAVPSGELSAHIKQALREYIARYAGQTVTVPVALRRLRVPALPGDTAAATTGPEVEPSATARQPHGTAEDAPLPSRGEGPAHTEASMDPETLAALRALNARFEG